MAITDRNDALVLVRVLVNQLGGTVYIDRHDILAVEGKEVIIERFQDPSGWKVALA